MWQAFINFWKGYVNFTGRSTRAEFWWMRLWSTIIFFVWLILFVIALVSDSSLISKVDKSELTSMVGVVEHGLFLNIVDKVVVGRDNGVEIFDAHPQPLI
ncbi:ribose-5-phosphate isomerase A [Weissella confusa]|uniref:Ribose-5-phosphate isomerase A n=1 Tax=Weissella confusa TaxID=1583 RepID=A0A923SMH6_WEICO|nr:ribose-5-phosphate isomerase A [Weissella confusa]